MRAEHYISELLYRYECVTLPGFGSFLTHYQSARIHETTHAFYPPAKKVSFNAQLTANDGLLARHMATSAHITYEQALQELEELGVAWKKLLRNGEKLRLEQLGDLWLNEASKIQFEPSHRVNYLTEAFGLGSFVSHAIKREVLKSEVQSLEEKTPLLFTPEKRNIVKQMPEVTENNPSTERSPYLKYAAIFLLALSTGLTGYRLFQNQGADNASYAVEEAQQRVEQSIQEATFFDTVPVKTPVVHLPAASTDKRTTKGRYHIIGGAFRVEANAEKRIRQLQKKGYKAQHVGINKYGLHQVAYGSFSNVQDALDFLRNVKTFENQEAWLWVE